jgi:hypothetical protein
MKCKPTAGSFGRRKSRSRRAVVRHSTIAGDWEIFPVLREGFRSIQVVSAELTAEVQTGRCTEKGEKIGGHEAEPGAEPPPGRSPQRDADRYDNHFDHRLSPFPEPLCPTSADSVGTLARWFQVQYPGHAEAERIFDIRAQNMNMVFLKDHFLSGASSWQTAAAIYTIPFSGTAD